MSERFIEEEYPRQKLQGWRYVLEQSHGGEGHTPGAYGEEYEGHRGDHSGKDQ